MTVSRWMYAGLLALAALIGDTTEDDVAKWNRLRHQPVDYTQLVEDTDETALKDVAACAGGSCELL